jgi:histidyl-tRNA synthetase
VGFRRWYTRLLSATPPAASRADLARDLRRRGFAVELPPGTTLKKGLARADKTNARWAILIGEAEAAAGEAQVKDLDAKTQTACRLDAVAGLVG